MSSALFDEETTSEHRDIGKKVLTHLKSFYFFIYYELGHLSGEGKKMNLEVRVRVVRKYPSSSRTTRTSTVRSTGTITRMYS